MQECGWSRTGGRPGRCGVVVGCALVLVPLAGCRTEAPKLTQEEKAIFKGGEMPPEVRKQMEESMRKNQEAMKNQGGGPPPAAAPPGPAAAPK